MRSFLLTGCIGAVAFFATGGAYANDELIKLSQDPKEWALPTGDYANQRYYNNWYGRFQTPDPAGSNSGRDRRTVLWDENPGQTDRFHVPIARCKVIQA